MMDRNKSLKFIYKLAQLLKCEVSDLSKLSSEQAFYINSYLGKSTFLQACPGSGKTEVIGLKCAYEIKQWNNPIGGIAVITFTNSAATELSLRVRKYADINSGLYPHFIGTFDSWLHGYILQPYGHYLTGYNKEGDKSIRIIDDDVHAEFLASFTVNITRGASRIPVRATDYHYAEDLTTLVGHSDIVEGMLQGGISNEERRQLRENKKKFFAAGFATYSDAEIISYTILSRKDWLVEKFASKFSVIVVDECQDLSQTQIRILDMLRSKGTSLQFVGDLNQSIYEFRKVNPQDILAYIDANPFQKINLTNNYRSNQSIVNISQALIGSATAINANIAGVIETPCIIWQYTVETFSLLPQKFEQLIKDSNLDINRCAILARGKSTLMSLRSQSEKGRLSKTELFAMALHCWHKQDKNTEDIIHSLYYIGRAFCLLAYDGRGNGRTQYCPENFDVIEWRLLLKRFLNSAIALYPFEENGADLTWTQWVAKLKSFLRTFWPTLAGAKSDYNGIAAKLRAPTGNGNNPVKSISNNANVHNLVRTTTIHSVKGETLDAVMLVSHRDKTSRGGHYTHWLREGNFVEEHIRFAYVACSRPKHLLVIATPTLNQADLAKLRNLGFVEPA